MTQNLICIIHQKRILHEKPSTKFKQFYNKKNKDNKGYSYTLEYPNFPPVTINLLTTSKNYRLNFTLFEQSYKPSEFGDIKPNSRNNTFSTRIALFEEIIHIIFNAYILRPDELKDVLALSKAKTKTQNIKINDIIRDYLAYKEQKLKERSYLEYVSVINKLATVYGQWDVINFSRQSKKEIETTFNIITQNLKEARYNTYITIFSNFVDFLLRNYEHYNLKNKFNNHYSDIERKKEQAQTTHTPPSVEHYAQMINFIKQNQSKFLTLNLALDIMFECQVRPVEVMRIKIKHINFETNTIYMNENEAFKGNNHTLLLPKTIIDFIKKQIENKGLTIEQAKELYLFAKKNQFLGLKEMDTDIIRRQWDNMNKELNLTSYNYTLYGIKYYANVQKFNNMNANGVQTDDIIGYLQSLNAHSDRTTTARYLKDLGMFTLNIPENIKKAIENKHNSYNYSI